MDNISFIDICYCCDNNFRFDTFNNKNMLLTFDYKFYQFCSKIKTISINQRSIFKIIAFILRWKVVIVPLWIIEWIISIILIFPFPIYSNVVYLFVKHCKGFIGYYLRALYYRPKAKRWDGNILIDEDVILENIQNYEFSQYVQIDKRVIIACDVFRIGKYTHIAMGTFIGKGGRVIMSNYSGISYNCILIPCTEKVQGNLAGSMIPFDQRKIKSSTILLEKYSLIFSGCIVLPGVTLCEGAVASVGTIVKEYIPAWTIRFSNFEKERRKI